MSQQTASVSQTEEEKKIQMLHQLRELKKTVKNSSNDLRRLTLKEIDDKARYAEVWEKRRQEKLAAGKKVNIIFVCSRPACWGVFKSACEAFIADKRCNVKIVSIPEIGESGAWGPINADYGVNCRIIDGYNPYTKDWFDIKLLEPDYVFFQTPYNGHRPKPYQSDVVSSYAKICYSLYGISIFEGETTSISAASDFLKDVSVVFAQTEQYANYLSNIFKALPLCSARIILSGDARLESIKKLPPETESPVWHYPRSAEKFRVVWTPRWTKRGGFSNFWDYKDKILDLCRLNPDIEIVSRPHPLTFTESLEKGYMNAQDIDDYKNSYNTLHNARLDSRAEFHDTFISSDVLLTDMTSVFHDYMLTEKPIIYCHREDGFNEHSKAVAQGFYWARTWQEVMDTLKMIKSGNDYLKEKRKQIINEMYYMPAIGIGNMIKNYVTNHFFAEKTPEMPDNA